MGKRGGGFFKLHNTEFDFTRYDIYSTTDITNYKQAYRHNCLYIALKNGGLGEDKLESMKRFVINRIVPQCKLKDLCKAYHHLLEKGIDEESEKYLNIINENNGDIE